MENISKYMGSRIRSFRKLRKMTLQQLADAISKSRATVSKYETGEIALDVQTLYEISTALDIPMGKLMDYQPPREEIPVTPAPAWNGASPFFKASTLYFYFYDGRYKRLKEGLIRINKEEVREDGCQSATLSIWSTTESGRSSEIFYTGSVLYSDMLIRFSFLNRYNKLEQDLLYIFNPLDLRDNTEGLLCGISSADLMPCAFRCLVTLAPQEDYESLQQRLILTAKELRRWQKLNMLIVDNRD